MSYVQFVLKSSRTSTFRSASEAFQDANYATAIQRPETSSFDGLVAFISAMLFVAVFAYSFWKTIG